MLRFYNVLGTFVFSQTELHKTKPIFLQLKIVCKTSRHTLTLARTLNGEERETVSLNIFSNGRLPDL